MFNKLHAALQGTVGELNPDVNPDEMATDYDRNYERMEYKWDWFTVANYKKFFKKEPEPKLLEWKDGSWGLKRVHDGIFRDGVPQVYSGQEAGTITHNYGTIMLDVSHGTLDHLDLSTEQDMGA